MSKQYAKVIDATGEIYSVHSGNVAPSAVDGETIYQIDETNLGDMWRDPADGAFKNLENFADPDKFAFASGGELVTFTLPPGTIVKGRDSGDRWTDTVDASGVYEINTDTPGRIILKLSRAGYYRQRVVLNAT